MGFNSFLVTCLFVGAVAYVTKHDLKKLLGALKRPTENFLKDVKSELAAKPPQMPGAPGAVPPVAAPPPPPAASDAASKKLE